MSMTIEQRLQIFEDTIEISHLKASYCNAADGGWDRPSHNADKVASLFIDEGVWDCGEYGRVAGREAIRSLFREFQRFPFAFHRISNPVIKVNGDVATGEWHLLCPIIIDDKQSMWIGGMYNDEFVRTPEGWRFKNLKFTPAFSCKNEQGWDVGEIESVGNM